MLVSGVQHGAAAACSAPGPCVLQHARSGAVLLAVLLQVLSESGIASGIRRMEAVAGQAAVEHMMGLDGIVRQVGAGLHMLSTGLHHTALSPHCTLYFHHTALCTFTTLHFVLALRATRADGAATCRPALLAPTRQQALLVSCSPGPDQVQTRSRPGPDQVQIRSLF